MTFRQTSAALAALTLSLVASSPLDARRQGTGSLTVERLELAVDRIMAHRHYPGSTPADDADRSMLAGALQSKSDPIRAVAVRAEGRFEDKAFAPLVMPFLKDSSADVRAEAGNALALMLRRAQPAEAAPVLEAVLPRVASSSEAEPWMYDTLGRLPYTKADSDRVEPALVAASQRSTGVEVAERALVNLIARSVARDRTAPPMSTVAPETLTFLENRARGGDPWPVRVQAWRALQLLREKNPDLLRLGAAYRCTLTPDCGWQVREIAVDLIDAHDASLAPVLVAARRDPSLNVRLSALRRQASVIAETKVCAPLLEAIASPSEAPMIRLEAMSLLNAGCTDRAAIAARLSPIAAALSRPKAVSDWHEPARAIEALAKFDAPAAGKAIDDVATYPVWQVRAAAARAAATLKDDVRLAKFAHDTESNVTVEALKGLVAMNSVEARSVMLDALRSPTSDYQLVREAAEAFKQKPVPADRNAIAPLIGALARLTKEGKDTSRDPRTSILNRLKVLAAMFEGAEPVTDTHSWVAPDDPTLTGLLTDFDPEIAKLAASVIGVASGGVHVGQEPEIHPTERPAEQPSESEVRDAPASATITLTDGTKFEMTFLRNEAPIAVARFAKLVKAGYYTNLTFHRVEPLFVIQGGSPHANEYSGADRFLRDEIGLEHNVAGAVGLSTRGRDTADGQIFVDLTDQYRLDFIYTVIAKVNDLTPVLAVEDGATIKQITLNSRPAGR